MCAKWPNVSDARTRPATMMAATVADVRGRCRLIQDQHPCAGLKGVERASDRHPLPLSAGEVDAVGVAAAQRGVETTGQPGQEIEDSGPLRGATNRLVVPGQMNSAQR